MTRSRRRWTTRVGTTAALAVGGVLLAAAPVDAHVTVRPATAAQGSSEILSFSVPNESATASTVGVQVELPTKSPIASVAVQPMPGWTIAVDKVTLAKPVRTDDGQVTQAAGRITWTATAGGLTPGQFDLFTISA